MRSLLPLLVLALSSTLAAGCINLDNIHEEMADIHGCSASAIGGSDHGTIMLCGASFTFDSKGVFSVHGSGLEPLPWDSLSMTSFETARLTVDGRTYTLSAEVRTGLGQAFKGDVAAGEEARLCLVDAGSTKITMDESKGGDEGARASITVRLPRC